MKKDSSTKRQLDCTIIGDVLFDTLIYESPSALQLVCGGTSYVDNIRIEPGGSGNIAVGLSKLGGNVLFIGKAGNDAFGRFYEDDLIKHCVKSKILFDESHSTGNVCVFVDKNGERSFLVSRGANNFLSPNEVEQHENEIAGSKCLFVQGHSLVFSPQREAVFRAVSIARANTVKVIFDPGAHNLVSQYAPIFEKLVNLCDVIALNLDEAKALTNTVQLEDVIQHMSQRCSFVALTLGEEGCAIITPDVTFRYPSSQVSCIDSTGAGDTFVSALIYGLTRNLPLEKTAKLANWYASCNIQKLGARAFPSKDLISDYFSTI